MIMDIKEAMSEYKLRTCNEIESWDTDERFELIDGVIYLMSPPNRAHQKICGELYRQLANFLFGKKCEVYIAPFAVYLSGNDTRVEPDIVVVCDKSKLTNKGCEGTPDLVIEVLSPSTSRYDKINKYNKYLEAGVREYRIVDIEYKIISVYNLENGKYTCDVYSDENTIPVSVLDGCQIIAKDVFSE